MCRRCEVPFHKLDEEEQKAFCYMDFISYPGTHLRVTDKGHTIIVQIHYCPFCGRKLDV